jgi:hypothetical protein
MAFGNFVVRRNLRELGVPSCHRAAGSRNSENGQSTENDRKIVWGEGLNCLF